MIPVKQNTSASLGPGSYTQNFSPNGLDPSKSVVTQQPSMASFGTREPREMMIGIGPKNKLKVPGPGEYDYHVARKKVLTNSAVFL